MQHTNKKNSVLVSVVAMGFLLGGCAGHPPRDIPTHDNADTDVAPTKQVTVIPEAAPQTPGSYNSEVGLNSTPSVVPWLQFPVTTSLDDAMSDLWINTEDALLDDQPGDTSNSASGDESDDDTSDLWDRIRQGFELPNQQNVRIEKEADWFGRHQAYLDRVSERAQPYLHYIVNQVQQRGMPSEIALLPVVESAFQPYAYSSGRAAGIWQFIPGTGRRYGLKLNWWYDGRRDIMASTQAALDYLQYLHDTFNGDWLLALAAYNSGEGTVQKAIRANQRRHKPTDYWSLHLPRETEQYVPRLLALRDIVADPQEQGIILKTIADEPYLTAVKIDSQLDLATAAKMAEMDLDELHQLNPGFNRWATAPDGPHLLLVPLDKAAIFATNVAELPPEDRVHWVRHRVRGGETLSEIASRYRTTVKVVADLNKIKGHLIRRGQYLIIPITSRSDPVYKVAHRKNIPLEVMNASAKTVHTVRAGDSLWTLARRYGTTVRQLSRWNGISTRKLLHPGQKIIVGLGDTTDNSVNTVPTSLHTLALPPEVAKPHKITYTVRRGDSLSRISQRFRVTIEQVREWNDIKKNQRIQPGQELTLFVPLVADAEQS